MKKILFIIHGAARSGKGTIAACIEKQSRSSRRVKYADIIKEMLSVLLDEAGHTDTTFKEECIESCRKEQPLPCFSGLTPRTIMQFIGSEFRKEFNPDLWKILTIWRIQKMMQSDDASIIVDDVRMPHEMLGKSFVKDNPGWSLVALKVVRPDYVPSIADQDMPIPAHKRVVISPEGIMPVDVARKVIGHLMKHLNDLSDHDEGDLLELTSGLSEDDLTDLMVSLHLQAHEKQKAYQSRSETHDSEKELPDGLFDHVFINADLSGFTGSVDHYLSNLSEEHS